MPSKKKKRKGKGRVAAKSRKAKEDGAANEVKQDEDALLEEAINLAAAEREQLEAAAKNDEENNVERCNHGFSPLPRGHVCALFIQSFVRDFSGSNRSNVVDRFNGVRDALSPKYDGLWNNPDMMELIVSYFSAEGASAILEENNEIVRQSATFAILFDLWKDTITCNNDQIRKWGKVDELSSDTCDEHTIVSFFKKRIPCKCLDKICKEVKSIVKMGLCMNRYCPLPGRKVEASKLMHCEQCQTIKYCSIECQKQDWPSHKEVCVEVSNLWLNMM